MSHEALAVVDSPAAAGLAVRDRGYLSSQDVMARMTRILEIQKSVMKVNVHFGTIPGTPKPTLYKAGAEKLLATFQIAACPKEVIDLSTSDEVRYRVLVQGVNQSNGAVLGEAWGEASSNEEKYRWRKLVCPEEWDDTPSDSRREVWKKYDGKAYKAKQVRTSPADVANTILQMATKRGLIPMTRVVLACSDIFDQDLEDMPEELRESILEHDPAGSQEIKPPQAKSSPAPAVAATPEEAGGEQAEPFRTGNGGQISEKQAKRFYAIAKAAGWTDDQLKAWLKKTIGHDDDRQIKRTAYDDLCAEVGNGPR